jgi:hypothetical protein
MQIGISFIEIIIQEVAIINHDNVNKFVLCYSLKAKSLSSKSLIQSIVYNIK